ncbi:MAG: DotH/IcmK family type IV secretion protein [Alphaproteobacteria bacterium]|nr:DotH/IcmK family type IV secretion protein [Alphaproteobacteria bacterium]
MPFSTMTSFGRTPIYRTLLIAGILALASQARADNTGSAMPSLTSAPSASASSGQGQAVYPAQTTAPASAGVANLSGTNPTSTGNAPSGMTAESMPAKSPGIEIPSPPPPSAFSNDPNQLAAQAEQAALQAQTQADMDEQKREQEHIRKSYDRASTGLLPLSPDQIHGFMDKLEETQNAAQFPAEGAPKGQTRIATISLEPGVVPPQINLATGYVTTITMVDASGEPWPILDVGVGGNFEVSPTQAGTHVVRVMPLTRIGSGDLSILLKDLPTPVIFRLTAGGPNVDLRYDARIGKLGPGAKPQIISRPRLEAGDETLTLLLENAPPPSATRLKVGGLDARTKAWGIGDKVYVRTPLTLLSPAWNASVAAADGTTVYEIGSAPVLLMSDNGAMIRAQISRDEDHDK